MKILGNNRLLYTILLFIFTITNVICFYYYCYNKNNTNNDRKIYENEEAYKMASQVLFFYMQMEYISIEPYQQDYSIDFNRYKKILDITVDINRTLYNYTETKDDIPSNIQEELDIFIGKALKLTDYDNDVKSLIEELQLKHLAKLIDNETKHYEKRKIYIYKLLLNIKLVSQLMIDKCTGRTVLHYPVQSTVPAK